MPQSHITPMKTIWSGRSLSGLGFMPQLGLNKADMCSATVRFKTGKIGLKENAFF